jgi:antitoxin ParD1/3/4
VRDLLRAAAERKANAHLEKLLLEGLDSGEPIEVNDQYWKDMRNELEEYIASRKKSST